MHEPVSGPLGDIVHMTSSRTSRMRCCLKRLVQSARGLFGAGYVAPDWERVGAFGDTPVLLGPAYPMNGFVPIIQLEQRRLVSSKGLPQFKQGRFWLNLLGESRRFESNNFTCGS
jgi:hypothetical protein